MNTLANFLPQHLQQNALPAELGSVLESIIAACVQINGKIRLGALSGVLGMAGTGNIQGEDQKKLDVIANEILIETLKQNPNVAGLASEEEDTFVSTDENGGYLVLFDPLDGSSNIDVNISVGTIFSILNKPAGRLNTESFLQKGNSQVGSGYVLYGPQTQLVFTLKHGVFIYPQDKRDPAKPGKLRLMYEANPMSLILKQAGGASSNALETMLDIQPIGLHQRVAVVMGSREEVEYVDKLHLG